jgi:hypothetical protein
LNDLNGFNELIFPAGGKLGRHQVLRKKYDGLTGEGYGDMR